MWLLFVGEMFVFVSVVVVVAVLVYAMHYRRAPALLRTRCQRLPLWHQRVKLVVDFVQAALRSLLFYMLVAAVALSLETGIVFFPGSEADVGTC